MPNYADFIGVVNNETDKAVLLSGSSIALLFTALGEGLEKHTNWTGSGEFGELTDTERDSVDALLAKAERELMTVYEGTPVTETGIIFMSPADRVGALLCDGSQYLRVDYPELYAFLIGTDYIVDADHFVVPDMMDVFVMGDETPGNTGGEATHVLTVSEMPQHNHAIYRNDGQAAFAASGSSNSRVSIANGAVFSVNGEQMTTGNHGGNFAHNNLPPYTTMRFYIWT